MKALFLLGRIVFGGFFLYSGINHLRERRGMAQYAEAKKVPGAEAAVVASGLLLLAGGGSVLLGFKPKLGAMALIAFLAGVSPMMHDFWTAEDPQQRMGDMVHFMKNMALLGAAMALAGVEEPWPLSVTVGQQDVVTRARRAMGRFAA